MALNELKSLTRSMVAGRQHVRGCILEGLQEAIIQFNRLLQNSKQVCVMLLMKPPNSGHTWDPSLGPILLFVERLSSFRGYISVECPFLRG